MKQSLHKSININDLRTREHGATMSRWPLRMTRVGQFFRFSTPLHPAMGYTPIETSYGLGDAGLRVPVPSFSRVLIMAILLVLGVAIVNLCLGFALAIFLQQRGLL